ncbi:MAG: S8 family serine peptidase, partial [Pyrinomonadaceae bacterium]
MSTSHRIMPFTAGALSYALIVVLCAPFSSAAVINKNAKKPVAATRQASQQIAASRPDEVLVRFRAGVTEADRANAIAGHPGRRRSSLRGESGVEKVELADGENVDTVAAQLRLHPAVEFAEPNLLIQRNDLPLEAGAAGQLPRAPQAMPYDLNRPSRFDP